MENKYFGCEPLGMDDMQQIQGGAYVANLLTLVKGAYFLTKDSRPTCRLPARWCLVCSLLL